MTPVDLHQLAAWTVATRADAAMKSRESFYYHLIYFTFDPSMKLKASGMERGYSGHIWSTCDTFTMSLTFMAKVPVIGGKFAEMSTASSCVTSAVAAGPRETEVVWSTDSSIPSVKNS